MLLSIYPILILLAPAAAAVLSTLPPNWLGRRAYTIGALAHGVAFAISLLALREVSSPGHAAIHLSLFFSPRNPLWSFALSIDRLAAVMMVLISGIGTLIHLFSIRYMQSEPGRSRFHALLALAIAALLCMVSSANLLMLFLCWQLLSWLLSLLAHNHAHPPTVAGAFRTFVTLRIGDVAFLAGTVLAFSLYGTLDFEPLFARAAAMPITLSLFWPGSGIEINGTTAVAVLIFIGAMSKSAQFPLHLWVPDSLYAPTPVSALLHAGIINAGGFLLNRLAPLYSLSPAALHLVFAVGLLTALLGASMMLTQNDIKKTLGYSTIGQMGYMIIECGLGAFALAVFHLIAHGLFKATIFLNCGHVIHAARQDPRVPPRDQPADPIPFSLLTWLTGFAATLFLPLIILLATHGLFRLPLRNSQGAVIFLFFSWVTSSQAILTLYRLRAVASRKVAALMLLMLILVVSTYLLAANAFTDFLYPAPGQVAADFQAAALPGGLFDGLVAGTALLTVMGWVLIYAKSHGRSIRMPGWIAELQVRLYLLFMNRLYLDALLFRIGRGIKTAAQWLRPSPLFPPFLAVIILGWALRDGIQLMGDPISTLARLGVVALLLPLFPLQGAYIGALTRLPGSWPPILAVILPAAGLYEALHLIPELPPELLRSVRRLALVGALYGSWQALAQVRSNRMLAYSGLAFISILWWSLSVAGNVSHTAVAYLGSVALVTGGILYLRRRLEMRFGDLELIRIGGLARPMPRFAVVLVLLVMAAMGLPPFGLFSGFLALLLQPSIGRSITESFALSGGLIAILLCWFAASWYLFRMMQRLLFGPHRAEFLYEDLRRTELAPVIVVLLLLLALGLASDGLSDASTSAYGNLIAMEWKPWSR